MLSSLLHHLHLYNQGVTIKISLSLIRTNQDAQTIHLITSSIRSEVVLD